MLGCDPGSWGYQGDDGKAFSRWESYYSSRYGDPYGKGDTIGCSVNLEKETAFFTKNGKLIGMTLFEALKVVPNRWLWTLLPGSIMFAHTGHIGPLFRGEVGGKLYPAISFECHRGGGCI